MTYSAEILADNPYLYWRLGEPSGTTAADASGNGRTGTYQGGPTLGVTGLLTGDANTAMSMTKPADVPLTYATSGRTWGTTIPTFTFEVVLNLPSTMNYTPIMVFADGASGLFAANPSYGIDFSFYDSSAYVFVGNYPYTANTTFHVAALYDGTNGILYVDGVAVSTVSASGGLDFFGNMRAFALNYAPASTSYAGSDPIMEEAAFYSHALTPTQVATHFAAVTGGGYSTAVLSDSPDVYYRLGDASGTTMVDSSGNSHNGTYVNVPALGHAGLLTGAPVTSVQFAADATVFPHVNVESNADIPSGLYPNFSIEAIIKPVANDANNPWVVIGGLDSNTDYSYISLNYRVISGLGSIDFGASSSSAGWDLSTTDGTIDVDTIYHVVGTWDGSTATVYINGSVTGTLSSAIAVSVGNPTPFFAGGDLFDNNAFGDNYYGTLDEVAFYTTALSAGRVLAHYNASIGAGPPPTVTSVTPSTGATAGATSVAIVGTNFTSVTAVRFGGVNATSYIVNSSTSITAVSPAHAAGVVDVIVTTANGTSSTGSADQFTYAAPPAPTVSSVSPATGPAAGGISISLVGTGFTGATAVTFGATSAASFTVNSATSITAVSPVHAAGVVDITVTGPTGTSATSGADHYTFSTAPYISSVASNSGGISGGTGVTITGSQFTGVTAVSFGGTPATSFTFNSDTSIAAIAPAHAAGATNVRVKTAAGTSVIVSGDVFTYTSGGGGVIPTAIRWVFFDPANASTVTFELNPDAATPPSSDKHIVVQNALAPGGKTLLIAISDDAQQITFSGTILTQTMYNLLVTWFNKTDPIELTDDLGRTYTIMMTKFDPKRVQKHTNFWFHTYSCTAQIIG